MKDLGEIGKRLRANWNIVVPCALFGVDSFACFDFRADYTCGRCIFLILGGLGVEVFGLGDATTAE